MHLLLSLAGLVVGLFLAAWGDGAYALGAAAGVLLGLLGAEIIRLRDRLRRLELKEPTQALPSQRDTATTPPAQPVQAGMPPPAAPRADAGAEPAAVRKQAPEPAAPRMPSVWQRGVRWLLSGNVPVKLGVLVSFFGVAFLLKYAGDEGWLMLPVELRLAGVTAFGILLLVIGWRLRDRYRVYALSLQGGGVGILYLTIFAAFRLYDLMPAGVAFTVLIVLVVGTSLLAYLQQAQALAVLGSVGGFLAPLLISTGTGNHVALFAYYTVLNLAVFALAWVTHWRWLNLISFFSTFGVGTVWGYQYYRPDLFASTEPFLILNFVLYTVIAALYGLRAPLRLRGIVDGTLVFGTPVACFPLQAALLRSTDGFGLAFSALAAATIYLALAFLLWRYKRAQVQTLFEAFISLAVAFATVAVPLALSAQWTAVAWSLEGAALVWVGLRQERFLARLAGMALIFGGGVAYAKTGIMPAVEAWPLLNGEFLAGLLLFGAASAAARLLQNAPREEERILRYLIYTWGLLWWLAAGVAQVARFAGSDTQVEWLAGFFAVTALIGLLAARRWRDALLAAPWFGLLPALGLCAAALPLVHDAAPLPLAGWIAWPLALLVHYTGFRLTAAGFDVYRAVLRGAGLWLVAALAGLEVAWYFDAVLGTAAVWQWAVQLAMLALAVEAGLRLAARHREPAWRDWGSLPLTGAIWLATLAANLELPGDADPLPYLPLLNPLTLASLLAPLLTLRVYGAFGAGSAQTRQILYAALGAAGLFLLTTELARTVHHWTDVPFRLESLANSLIFQSAVSISWAIAGLACMVLGARHASRMVWLAGAGLMGIVVVKLFIVDLGGSGTVERIISFIGVGVLLLLVGYLAPVPARSGGKA